MAHVNIAIVTNTRQSKEYPIAFDAYTAQLFGPLLEDEVIEHYHEESVDVYTGKEFKEKFDSLWIYSMYLYQGPHDLLNATWMDSSLNDFVKDDDYVYVASCGCPW